MHDRGSVIRACEGGPDGETLRFSGADDRHFRADGSRWERTTGRATDVSHWGTRLPRANERSPLFRGAWTDLHPDSRVWTRPADVDA